MKYSWRTSAIGGLTILSGIVANLIELLQSEPALSIEGLVITLVGAGFLVAKDAKE